MSEREDEGGGAVPEVAPSAENELEWDVLCRMHDPVAVGALVSLLDAEKIRSTTPGLAHRGMLGVLGAYVEIVVSVPRPDLERARTLLGALQAAPDEILEGPLARTASDAPSVEDPSPRPSTPARKKGRKSDAGQAAAPTTNDDEPPRGEAPRLRRVAAFVSLTPSFGSGHFYARDTLGGGLLLGAQVAAIACLFFGSPLVALSVPAIALCDLVGAQLVISRVRAGGAPVALGRALPLLAVAALLLAPLVRATSPETLAAPAGVFVCEAAAQCGGEARMLCIEGFADRRMAGSLVSEALEACAMCIEPTHTCAGLAACAPACVDTIVLPVRAAPPGARDDDDDFVRLLRDLPGADPNFVERARRGGRPGDSDDE